MEENTKYIDFNIDLALFFDDENVDRTINFVEKVSSVNIDCGINSRKFLTIKNAVKHCKFKDKVLGANIALPDYIIDPLSLSYDEIEAIILYQLGALSAFAKSESLNVEYVRPQSSLFKLMNHDLDFSIKVAKAVKKFSEWFVLYGPAGGILAETGSALNMNVAHEFIPHCSYNVGLKVNFNSKVSFNLNNISSRLKKLHDTSEIELEDNTFEKVSIDTVHFSPELVNIDEILSEASNIFVPRPVNYNNVVTSGWV